MTSKRILAIACMAVSLILSSGSFAETYVFPAEPAVLTETDISMVDAISIAKNEMSKQQGISLDEFQNFTIKANCVKLVNNEKAWVVMLDEMAYGTDALVTISSSDATIIQYQASDTEITIFLIEQWTKEKGAIKTWSIEDMALFNLLFGSSDEYIVPGAEHISQGDAERIALSAIPQSLSAPEFSCSFNMLSYTNGRPDLCVWMVTILAGGKDKYLVHISAIDGSVIEVFDIGNALGKIVKSTSTNA